MQCDFSAQFDKRLLMLFFALFCLNSFLSLQMIHIFPAQLIANLCCILCALLIFPFCFVSLVVTSLD